jgi:hypothetical protein
MSVAILFLTVDPVLNWDVWMKWRGKNKANFYVNAKHPAKLPKSQKQFAIKDPVTDTEWCWRVIYAHIAMLKKALENAENEWFVLVSGDSIPTTNFNTFCTWLKSFAPNTSHISRQAPIASALPPEFTTDPAWADNVWVKENIAIHNQHQSHSLSREHATVLASMPTVYLHDFQVLREAHKKVGIMLMSEDETVPLSYLKHLRATSIEDLSTMYNRFGYGSPHAMKFKVPQQREVAEAEGEYFFARKTMPDFPKQVIRRMWAARNLVYPLYAPPQSFDNLRRTKRERRMLFDDFKDMEDYLTQYSIDNGSRPQMTFRKDVKPWAMHLAVSDLPRSTVQPSI